MISSVICELCSDESRRQHTLAEIDGHPHLESGNLVDFRKLPVVIDAEDAKQSKSVTEWLQQLDGVEFVDVVFVHFEDQPPQSTGH